MATLRFTCIYNEFFCALILIQRAAKRPITSAVNRQQRDFDWNQTVIAPAPLVASLPLTIADNLLYKRPRLSLGRAAVGRADGRPLRRASRPGDVARGQRVRLPRRLLLLRRLRRGLPQVAAGATRLDRGPEQGVGDRLLVAALLELG